MKKLNREYGHWKIGGAWLTLLHECKAVESSRYAIEHIYANECKIAATDGRRLVELSIQHNIPEGVYPLTQDGYVLDRVSDGKFPLYNDVIPNKDNMKQIVKTPKLHNVSGLILGSLVHAGCIIDLDLFLPPMKALETIGASSINVWVDNTRPQYQPFLLQCESALGLITYVQMPVSASEEMNK